MSPYPSRRTSLSEWTNENELDAFLVTSETNLRYLTGLTGEGLAIISTDQPVVVTDRRYEVEAGDELADCEVIFAEQGHLQSVAERLDDRGTYRVGFESQHLTYAGHQKLSELAAEVQLTPTEHVVEKRRAIKEAREIAFLRRAAQVIDEALQVILATLTVGVSEREVALQLREQISYAGGDDVSFDPVVAFAERSAAAHAVAGNRKLAPGDVVLLDAGAKVDGYCSDMTRTVTMGEPGEKFSEVYRVVQQAQQAALAVVAPDVPAAEVDAQARAVIDGSEYQGKFGHSVGHGVGLEVHELPRLGKNSEDVLAAGQVVTIEPGIYLPEWGGIRLEEMVLVTKQGAEPLTQTPYLQL